MPYATLAELKSSMQKENVGDDVLLQRILNAAETKINRFCNRPDGFEADIAASARHYPGSSYSFQLIDECVSITTVAVKDSQDDIAYAAWTSPTTALAGDGDWMPCTGDQYAPDFVSLPYTMLIIDPNGDQSWFTGETMTQKKRGRERRGHSLLSRVPTVQVTALWGYSVAVPNDIREATIMQSARWYKKEQGAMADALASADLGGLLYIQQLDPDIAGILLDGAYRRPHVGRR